MDEIRKIRSDLDAISKRAQSAAAGDVDTANLSGYLAAAIGELADVTAQLADVVDARSTSSVAESPSDAHDPSFSRINP